MERMNVFDERTCKNIQVEASGTSYRINFKDDRDGNRLERMDIWLNDKQSWIYLNHLLSWCFFPDDQEYNEIYPAEIPSDPVSKAELQSVLDTMIQYMRDQGYMARDNGGKLRYFDGAPTENGCRVNRTELKKWIEEHPQG